MMRNKLSILLRAAVSLGLVGLLVWIFRKDLPGIATVLKNVSPYYFLASILFNISAVVVVSERLRMILAVQRRARHVKVESSRSGCKTKKPSIGPTKCSGNLRYVAATDLILGQWK